MFIDGKAKLHIIDTATHFSSSTFLDIASEQYGQSVHGICRAFVQTWCTINSVYPNRIITDQVSVFTSYQWKHLTNQNRIELRLSVVQVHSFVGIGENLNGPLLRIHRNMHQKYPYVRIRFVLNVSIKSINGTFHKWGWVPSWLVFSTLQRISFLNTDLSNQNDIMKSIKWA